MAVKKQDINEISRRYAQAIFELGMEENALDAMLVAGRHIRESLSKDITDFFGSPLYEDEEKLELLNLMAEKLSIPLLLKNALFLLVKNHRLTLIPEIFVEFQKKVDDYRGFCRGEIFSARPSDPQWIDEFEKALSGHLKKEIRLVPALDESLKAGFVVKLENLVVDASLKAQLKNMHQTLVQGD